MISILKTQQIYPVFKILIYMEQKIHGCQFLSVLIHISVISQILRYGFGIDLLATLRKTLNQTIFSFVLKNF